MKTIFSSAHLVFYAVLMIMLTGWTVSADTFNWNSAVTEGDFNADASWIEAGTPGPGDQARFNGVSPLAQFTANAECEQLKVYGDDADVIFDLGGQVCSFTSADNQESAGLTVGQIAGTSSLTISNGTLLSHSFELGRVANATGTLTLAGADTVWTNTGAGTWTSPDARIGLYGEGRLRIRDGARVYMNNLWMLRSNLGTNNTKGVLEISGLGSLLHNTNHVELGSARTFNSSEVIVNDGAEWTSTLNITLHPNMVMVVSNAVMRTNLDELDSRRFDLYGANVVFRDGAVFEALAGGINQRLQIDGGTIIAEGQTNVCRGRLVVESGSQLLQRTGFVNIYNGELIARDAGTLVQINYRLQMGSSAEGVALFEVQTGARARVQWLYRIGFVAGTTGMVNVVGSNARLETISNNQSLSGSGRGILRAANGGEIWIGTNDGTRLSLGSGMILAVEDGLVRGGGILLENDAVLDVKLCPGATNIQVHAARAAEGPYGPTNSGNLDLGDADFQLSLVQGFSSYIGEEFTIIRVEGTRIGEFKELPDGSIITIKEDRWLSGFGFQVNYNGGTSGKDFTLTTVALPASGTMFRFY